ncbi:hypothetical protein [Nonomuraea rubra]|uniref:rhamnogalacturonan lyase family protein n=1 Tax=Nonomuraea rubra TaxID=46180 RepID=UPI003CD055D3
MAHRPGPQHPAGAHYTQFQVYDYDGDGRAELAVKTWRRHRLRHRQTIRQRVAPTTATPPATSSPDPST